MMQFKAAMFDFDGTLTEKGSYVPPKELADKLVELSQQIPIGFCTGRQLESFEQLGLSELLKEVDDHERPRFLENLYLFAENGSIGYDFDPAINDFKEIYRTQWPSEFIERAKLQAILNEAVKEYGDILYDAHRVVVVMRTNLYDDDEGKINEVYSLAGKIYKITLRILTEINPNFHKYVHVGNSGIGVVIVPAEGDKDAAIKRFGQFLSKSRGIKFERNFKDILAVGDSAQEGGNDFYFLNGRYGTPYSVGEDIPDNPALNLVFDKSGKRLLNATGTLALIKTLLLA